MSAKKLDVWTLEMLMAIAMADWPRVDVAVAMGANTDIYVAPEFLESLRLRQERVLGECLVDAEDALIEIRRSFMK